MATKEYPNFYENIKEATIRLQYTVVTYDDEPYYILAICDHKDDGIFRVYMEPIGHPEGNALVRLGGIPCDHPDSKARGQLMDSWLESPQGKASGVIRKMLNSPAFNRFKPFPLGMANSGSKTYYIERQPVRHTQQGLTANMLYSNEISLNPPGAMRMSVFGVDSPPIRDTILGKYPSVSDCLKNLSDPEILNDAVGFHRNFAFVRGPISTMFLAYKSDIVGLLVNGDLSKLKLPNQYRHTKEIIESLNLFNDIIIN